MTSVLPQGWKVERLVDLVSVRSGQVDPRVDPYRDMPLIAPDHVESGTGRLLEVQTAHDQGAISGKYPVDAGDVIYSKIRPYLMKAHLAEFAALCSADMYPLKPRRGADSRFVLNVLLGREFTNYAVGESMRSGIPKINREGLAGYELAVPPDAEQAAIGEALADADRLIDALECLIIKKQAIKTGMMQELLLGKTRLPGHSKYWESVTLGESGEISGGGVDKRTVTGEQVVTLINYLDVYRNEFIKSDTATQKVTASPRKAISCQVRAGDVLFTPTSETPDDIARSAVVQDEAPNTVYSYHLVRWRPYEKWDVNYLGFMFSQQQFRSQVTELAAGSGTRYVVSMPGFRSLQVLRPPLEEQREIGLTLRSIFEEIEVLKKLLVKAQALKQGMMQQLLTGRTRLPVETGA